MTSLSRSMIFWWIWIGISTITVESFVYRSFLKHHQVLHHPATSERISDLQEWLENNVKKGDGNVYFAQQQNSIQAYAKKDLVRNDVLLSTALSNALDSSAIPSEISRWIDINSLQTRSVGVLSLILLYEQSLGKSSKFYPYLQSLPPRAPGILSWTTTELEELTLSSTREFKVLFSAIEEDIQYLQSCTIPFFTNFVEEKFRWAIGIVKSKRLRIQDHWYLVPGIDSITFDPFADNEPFLTSEGLFGRKLITIKADRKYRANELVYMSYGIKSAAQCIEDHGILPTTDQLSDLSVEITLEITPDDAFENDKLAILEEWECSSINTFDLYGDASLDSELLQFLRLKLISGKDSFILEPCLRNTIKSALLLPFSRNNEREVMNYLLQYCHYHLEKIQNCSMNSISTRNDNPLHVEMNINPDKMNEYQQMSPTALLSQLRSQEQKVLAANIQYLQSELDSLQEPYDQREYYQERRLKSLDLLRPLDPNEVVDSE